MTQYSTSQHTRVDYRETCNMQLTIFSSASGLQNQYVFHMGDILMSSFGIKNQRAQDCPLTKNSFNIIH
jgi:hypothetical protein